MCACVCGCCSVAVVPMAFIVAFQVCCGVCSGADCSGVGVYHCVLSGRTNRKKMEMKADTEECEFKKYQEIDGEFDSNWKFEKENGAYEKERDME